jgi:hypothetical protein
VNELDEAVQSFKHELWQVIEPKIVWCLDKVLKFLRMMRAICL